MYFYNNCLICVLYLNSHCWQLNYSFWTHHQLIPFIARYCYKALREQHACWEQHFLKWPTATEISQFIISLGLIIYISLWNLEIATAKNATKLLPREDLIIRYHLFLIILATSSFSHTPFSCMALLSSRHKVAAFSSQALFRCFSNRMM